MFRSSCPLRRWHRRRRLRRCSHSPPSHHLPCSAGQGCAAAYPHLYPALPYSAGVAAAATVCAPPFALTPPFALSPLAPPAPFGRLEGRAVAYLHLCPTLPYSADVVAAAPVHAAAVLPLLAPLPYSGLRVARCGYSYSKGLTLPPHSSGAVAHSAAGTPPPLAPLLALAPPRITCPARQVRAALRRALAYIPPCLARQVWLPPLAPSSLALSRSLHLP